MGSEENKPSLEAPALGFRRRKKKSPPPPSGEQPTEPVPAPVDDTPPTPVSGEQATEPVPAPVDDTPPTEVITAPTPEPRPEPAPTPRAPRHPLNGHVAAALAGVVVAALLVLGTYGGLQTCESVRGTSSCGGGPGFFLLVLIVVVAVVVGALVLRWAQVPSAGSISVLAVALVAVLSVLFLLDSLDELAGAVAVAVLTVAAYLLAHWVTVRFIDAAD
jgi:hypothetical protein